MSLLKANEIGGAAVFYALRKTGYGNSRSDSSGQASSKTRNPGQLPWVFLCVSSGIAIQRCLGKLRVQLWRCAADADATDMLAVAVDDRQTAAQQGEAWQGRVGIGW